MNTVSRRADIDVVSHEAPATSQREWDLRDLIDVPTLQAIQDAFARAFDLPTIIVYPDGSNVTQVTNRVTFCEGLTRETPVGGKRCLECDVNAMRQAQSSDQPAIFKCWNKLYDCAIPIMVRGRALGYFLVGQIFTSPPNRESYRATARQLGIPEVAYIDALKDVRIVPMQRFEASVHSMHVLATLIGEQAQSAIENYETLKNALLAREDARRLLAAVESVLDLYGEISTQTRYVPTLSRLAGTAGDLITHDCIYVHTTSADGQALLPIIALGRTEKHMSEGLLRNLDSLPWRAIEAGKVERSWMPADNGSAEADRRIARAAIAAPITVNSSLWGVMTLVRHSGGPFQELDERLATVLAVHAAICIELCTITGEHERSDAQVRLVKDFSATVVGSEQAEEVLEKVAVLAVELFEATDAVCVAQVHGTDARWVGSHGLAPKDRLSVLRAHEQYVVQASIDGSPLVVPDAPPHVLVVPFLSDRGSIAAAIVRSTNEGHRWEDTEVALFLHHAGLAIENVLLRAREQELAGRLELLARLEDEVWHSATRSEVEACLARGGAELVGAPLCFIARFGGSTSAITVHTVDEAKVKSLSLRLKRSARLAGITLARQDVAALAEYQMWTEEVFHEVSRVFGPSDFVSAPIRDHLGLYGGIFACWHTKNSSNKWHRRLLEALARCASVSLAHHEQDGDNSLTTRERELEALLNLFDRLAGCLAADDVVAELTSFVAGIPGIRGAAFVERGIEGPALAKHVGLGDECSAAVAAAAAQAIDGEQSLLVLPGRGETIAVLVPALSAPGAWKSGGLVVVGGSEAVQGSLDMLRQLVDYGGLVLGRIAESEVQSARLQDSVRELRGLRDKFSSVKGILESHRSLTKVAIHRGSLDDVARGVAQFLHCDVVIIDRMGNHLAAWPPDAGFEPLPAGTARSDDPDSMAEVFRREGLPAAPAILAGRTVGWMVIRGVTPERAETARTVTEFGAALVAVCMLQQKTADEVEARLRGGFLEALLTGEVSGPALARQGASLGFQLTEPSRVWILRPASASMTQENLHALRANVASDLDRLVAGALVSVHRRDIVLLVPEDQPNGSSRLATADTHEGKLRAALRRRMPSLGFNLAVGTECTEPEEFPRSFRAASWAVDLLDHLGKEHEILSFRTEGISQMMLVASDPHVLERYVQRFVRPLDAYDRVHSSELRATLETLYDVDLSLQKAARQLHIHVSTLRYRLGKCDELLGVNVRHGEGRLSVEVALKAARIIDIQTKWCDTEHSRPG